MPFPHPVFTGYRGVRLIGSTAAPTGVSGPYSPNLSSLGAVVGDLALVTVSDGAGAVTGPSGWTHLSASWNGLAGVASAHVWWKVLAASDMTPSFNWDAVNAGNGCALVAVFRGATSLNARTDLIATQINSPPAPQTKTIAGFTPDPNSAGLIGYLTDYNGLGATAGITAPAPATPCNPMHNGDAVSAGMAIQLQSYGGGSITFDSAQTSNAWACFPIEIVSAL